MPSPSLSSLLEYEFTEEDGAFLNGVFDAETANAFPMWNSSSVENLAIDKSTKFLKSSNSEKVPSTPTFSVDHESSEFVDKIGANDIICVRGAGGNHPGNKMFRQLIHSHKPLYDTMNAEERDSFSEKLWTELREKGTRFLKPTGHDQRSYEVLNLERSVRKILFALRDCRIDNRKVNVEPFAVERHQLVDGSKRKATKTLSAADSSSTQAINFDDVARAEISKVMQQKELFQAMKSCWQKDFEGKQRRFESQLLQRYRAAAMRGMSPEIFSHRLVKVLLKEIRHV